MVGVYSEFSFNTTFKLVEGYGRETAKSVHVGGRGSRGVRGMRATGKEGFGRHSALLGFSYTSVPEGASSWTRRRFDTCLVPRDRLTTRRSHSPALSVP